MNAGYFLGGVRGPGGVYVHQPAIEGTVTVFYVAHLGPQRDDRGNVVVMSKELVWETHETEKKNRDDSHHKVGPIPLRK